MAPRPAKRQKRLVLPNSDDEEPLVEPKKQSEKKNTKDLPISSRLNKHDVSNSKREKPGALNSRQSTQKSQPKSSTRQISSFFAVAGGPGDAKTGLASQEANGDAVPAAIEKIEDEDLIEDISDYEKSSPATQQSKRYVLDRRKTASKSDDINSNSSPKGTFPGGTQKFILRSKGSEGTESRTEAKIENREPWIERFPPSNLEELAVHKKKMSDVRSWLENVLSGKSLQRLLVLKGPAGAGKTTTLKMLAEVLQLEISEWKNPMGSQYASEGYISMSAHFDDFLGRSGKFNTLEFDSISNEAKSVPTAETNTQKIVLIEEFPNITISTSTALSSFRSSILQSLAARTSSYPAYNPKVPLRTAAVTPLILIITETRLTSTTVPTDVFTAHRLLGSEILNHPAVSAIEFNPVAPTFIKKALDLVIRKEAGCSGRRRTPGSQALARLCEIGDVRSAISSLEFLCVKGQDSDDWSGRVAARKQRGTSASSALTKLEKESLEAIYPRGNSIGLFHAVGKVVYNKREDPALTSNESFVRNAIVQPPDHLQEHVRLRQPETSVDKLMDEMGTDADTFIAALHENYVMSCEGPNLVDNLDGCLSALSDSDLLSTSRGARSGQSSFVTSSENLRRDEIAFQLAVRGLLFALPYPVKRSTHPTRVHGRTGGKSDTHKMFYPVSMRLWRETEQIEESIDQWCRHFRDATASSGNLAKRDYQPFKPEGPGGVTEHIYERMPLMDYHQRQGEPVRMTLTCTKVELLLERLPYIKKIGQAGRPSTNHLGLESITQFHGINLLRDDASEDEGLDDLPIGIALSSKQPVMQQPRKDVSKGQIANIPHIEDDVEKLYLSEDDIED